MTSCERTELLLIELEFARCRNPVDMVKAGSIKWLVVSRVNSARAHEAHNEEDNCDLGRREYNQDSHKSDDETARRQGNPTHCREQERAKQQCADSSTASGGGNPLAPPRSSTRIKVEAVKQKSVLLGSLRRYKNVQLKGQTGKQDGEKVEKRRQKRSRCEFRCAWTPAYQ